MIQEYFKLQGIIDGPIPIGGIDYDLLCLVSAADLEEGQTAFVYLKEYDGYVLATFGDSPLLEKYDLRRFYIKEKYCVSFIDLLPSMPVFVYISDMQNITKEVSEDGLQSQKSEIQNPVQAELPW